MNQGDAVPTKNGVAKNNVVFVLEDEWFEWDANKAKTNIDKHGVPFEEAAEAFFDPNYQEGDATDNEETRSFILGYSYKNRLLCVVHIERGDRTRIISARLAETYERKQYENANQ